MTTPRDVETARAIIDCADDRDLLVGGETYYGGEVCSGVEVAQGLIAAALSERERETVERILDMVYSELARAPELYGDEWQERIRHADAARRETP